MRASLAIALLCVACAAGTANAQVEASRLTPITLPAELDRVLRDYERLWESGNAQGLADIFTEDGYIPGKGGWISGREAIRGEYARAGGALRLRAYSYATNGDVGYIIGGYRYGPSSESDAGKFVLALRRAKDGKWLIAADLDGSNRRP